MKSRNERKINILLAIFVVVVVISLNISWIGRFVSYHIKFSDMPKVGSPIITKEDYISDFDYAYDVLKETYPYFEVNKKLSGVDWLANRDKYRAEISKSTSDSDFYKKMNDILEDLHNGHTHLINEKEGLSYYMIYKMNSWGSDLIGELASEYEYPTARARYNINNDTVKEAFKKHDSDDYMDDLSGNEGKSNVQVGDIKKDLAYIKVNVMQNGPGIEKDEKVILPYLEKIKNYKALVIDIRGNAGGNSSYYTDFLYPIIIDKPYSVKNYLFIRSDRNPKIVDMMGFEKLNEVTIKSFGFPAQTKDILKDFNFYNHDLEYIKPNKNSIRFKGNIYLLVDKGVYSSAEGMASFTKESGLATLVGEKTGGDGIGFDPMQVHLPKTGYVMRYSYSLGTTESGLINELEQTRPDIVCSPDTSGPLINQPCIKEILKREGKI